MLEEWNRVITIQLIQKGTLLFYEIRNPYKKRDPEPELGEKNPKLHGYGLKMSKDASKNTRGQRHLFLRYPFYRLDPYEHSVRTIKRTAGILTCWGKKRSSCAVFWHGGEL